MSQGENYGTQEAVYPMLIFTATIESSVKELPCMPLETADVVFLKKNLCDVIVKNFAENGVDLIASGGSV